MRIVALGLSLLTLTACYDFKGERGRLGFSTDATVDGGEKWSPHTPLASGARPRLEVGEVLRTGKEPEGDVRFDSTRGVSRLADEGGVLLAGEGRGWVGAEVDGVRDEFRLRWKEADRGRLIDPLAALLGLEPALDEVFIAEGHSATLGYSVLDRRGDPLGFVPDQLEISADPELLIAVDGSLEFSAARSGLYRLFIAWPGAKPTELEVEFIDPQDIDRIELTEYRDGADCALLAQLYSGSDPVISSDGFVWSHDDSTGPLAICGAEVSVSWGDLRASP